MVCGFGSIFDETTYESDVILINGRYNFFNNMVCDKVKDKYCIIESSGESSFMSEFTDGFESSGSNVIGSDTIEEFIELNKIPSVTGKRVCTVSYEELNKKQATWFDTYIKRPSKYGILVVIFNDFKNSRKYQRSKFVVQSDNVRFINLSFPNRNALKRVIKETLSEYTIDDKALDLFVWRLSDNYEMYNEAFDKVRTFTGQRVTYDDMKELLVGIDNYNIDDFIRMLLSPPRNKKGRPKNIYKALNCLINDLGPRKLCNKVLSAFERVLEMRLLLNDGKLSANGIWLKDYHINKLKEELPDDSKLKNMSNFAIKKYYNLAKQTSMRDIMISVMMLENNRIDQYSSEQYERILYSVVNRCTFNSDRVMNDCGIKNTLDESLQRLNSISIE